MNALAVIFVPHISRGGGGPAPLFLVVLMAVATLVFTVIGVLMTASAWREARKNPSDLDEWIGVGLALLVLLVSAMMCGMVFAMS